MAMLVHIVYKELAEPWLKSVVSGTSIDAFIEFVITEIHCTCGTVRKIREAFTKVSVMKSD